MDKEKNRIALEAISVRLSEVIRLYSQLDLYEISFIEQRDWEGRMETCKNALEFVKDSIEKLGELIG